MKKILFASAIALFGLANAQTTEKSGFEGRVFLMGQVGYESTDNNNNNVTTNNFSIVPTVGYFVSPTVAVGLGIGYVNATTKNETIDTKYINDAFKVMPLARKYWGLGDKLYIFGQLAVPMEWGTDKTKVAGSETSKAKYSSYGVQIAPGLDYFLTNNWSVEATIGAFGYQNTKYKGAESLDNYNFGLNLSNIQLGVKYIF
ncbi:outer membrane beta-barrel protein [Chryseobacterium sp. CT-SW4]|uniref:outer membrane beta-barrel protein n=1 Tax=Chryseobacterium sp. SW-1 TaxID=3157343 RepID=UPI003B02BB48